MLVGTPQQLGECVRDVRKKAGITQPELALAAGVSLSFVGFVEAGKPTAEVGKCMQVLATLGIRIQLEVPFDD
jgi:y4mF family transcriptional regulator